MRSLTFIKSSGSTIYFICIEYGRRPTLFKETLKLKLYNYWIKGIIPSKERKFEISLSHKPIGNNFKTPKDLFSLWLNIKDFLNPFSFSYLTLLLVKQTFWHLDTYTYTHTHLHCNINYPPA